MQALIVSWWASIRESYWFVPSLLAIAAMVLAAVTTAIDAAIGPEWLEAIPWLQPNKPDGARAVLSTIAGSMITVAGVTFSMTILSISYTTGQVGPRLLNNFMRDSANQFTLGVFLATFLYCLMVLRTVRGSQAVPAEGGDGLEVVAEFVPNIAILIGLVLAVMSVGVLIFFIHHIPESFHVPNIVAGVGQELSARIESQFPSRVGRAECELVAERTRDAGETRSSEQRELYSKGLPARFDADARSVECWATGYIDYLDASGLMQLASEHDLQLRLRFRAGDFATERDVLLLAAPNNHVDDRVEAELRATFVLGNQRTPKQNVRFVINQLVEVAIRALSPGTNDPFTATNSMDWLQAGLQTLARRELPSARRYDDRGKLRIVAEPETFEMLLSLVCDQLRPYVAKDSIAAVYMMEMLAKVALAAETDHDRRSVIRQGCLLRRASKMEFTDPVGRRLVDDRLRTMIRMLRDEAYRQQTLENSKWIGGRA